MRKPKIVIFWGKPKGPIDGPNPQPYAKIGPKKPVYDQLVEALAQEAEVYIGVGYENYFAPLVFKNCFLYRGCDKFERIEGSVEADAVFDRSAKMSFPGNSVEENQQVLNSSNFKLFCNNKWALFQKFPQYCPETRYAENAKSYLDILGTLGTGKQYVVKPYNGLKGKGIEFGVPGDLKNYKLEVPVIIQDFKETSAGIPGLVKGRHDLRVVVIDGKIVWVTVRQPENDGLLANVAQGGSITEVNLPDVPKSVLPIVDHLSRTFKEEFQNPLFSIDFGFENGKPFIYEINDQIGFPLPEMTQNMFIPTLAGFLLQKVRSN